MKNNWFTRLVFPSKRREHREQVYNERLEATKGSLPHRACQVVRDGKIRLIREGCEGKDESYYFFRGLECFSFGKLTHGRCYFHGGGGVWLSNPWAAEGFYECRKRYSKQELDAAFSALEG